MDLAGQLLIAMPGMGDPRFARSVVFLCAYSDAGAMGLILNKHVPDMKLREVLSQLSLEAAEGPLETQVHYGGPVETARGFVLHREVSRSGPEPLIIPGEYVLTATQDVLSDIGAGAGPQPFLFALGYAGWAPGQLEAEIAQNGWLTAQASPELVFGGGSGDALWEGALRSIGIDPVSLSGSAGRA
jgi:putative transcriptional regulator